MGVILSVAPVIEPALAYGPVADAVLETPWRLPLGGVEVWSRHDATAPIQNSSKRWPCPRRCAGSATLRRDAGCTAAFSRLPQ